MDFSGRGFPNKDVILQCVRWYLAYNLSYRNIEEMMTERNSEVDHSTLQRRVVRYAPQLEQEFNIRFKKQPGYSSSQHVEGDQKSPVELFYALVS